jgi:calcium-translocating P-type ATPase
MAPDLSSVAAIVDSGVRRDLAVRDGVLSSTLSNLAGAAWGMGGNPRFDRGSHATYVAALLAIAGGYLRLHGGALQRSVSERLSDPQPERFGRRSVAETLAALDTSERGLTTEQARARWNPPAENWQRDPLVSAVLDQLESPLTAILAAGAAVSLLLGTVGDVAMIAAVITVNTAVGAWQERQAGRAAEALERLSARTATVLRDQRLQTVDAAELVPGDVICLAAGDRVPADARLIDSDGLEVDEASLTGESLPVTKTTHEGTASGRVVLEGSDVTVGTAKAVVVAVGAQTRMGATAAALALHETSESPLGRQLSRMFSQGLPLIGAGGVLVTVSGLLWRRPLIPQLALGASVAVAALPEGLPLLAGVTQAAVARRLAARNALVRRLAAVEALGRVDVACTDKTGTLTEGRLVLTQVADASGEARGPGELSSGLRAILEAAALATPHPEAPALESHPTDIAVVQGSERAGLTAMRDWVRDAEQPFEPSRGFHATRAGGRLLVKGAAEVVAVRCDRVRRDGADQRLDADGRKQLLQRADELSRQGLRVLMVAEGPPDVSVEDPDRLIALGYLGISDPLRRDVPAAVERCEAAGVRVIMLTGDHPATATAIARQAGLSHNGSAVLTGEELAALGGDELDQRLEQTRVIARVTPLDKLRIVEALRRRGHVVAMTGDGVNDAPALRLADVGVAMGVRGTDVAREAADVVLADDRFSTLVETLVEGRGFWRNIRRALGLLLGGNLGEMALMVGAGVAGLPAPLTTRQVLAVNLITDVLPAIAVAIQEPEHRNLAGLAREGTAAMDQPLRDDVIRRGLATGVPSLAAYAISSRASDPARARALAFTSIVSCQLSQTVDLGRAEGKLSGGVLAAVGGLSVFVASALAFPPLQRFMGLAVPTPPDVLLCAAATGAAVALSRMLAASGPLATNVNGGTR